MLRGWRIRLSRSSCAHAGAWPGIGLVRGHVECCVEHAAEVRCADPHLALEHARERAAASVADVGRDFADAQRAVVHQRFRHRDARDGEQRPGRFAEHVAERPQEVRLRIVRRECERIEIMALERHVENRVARAQQALQRVATVGFAASGHSRQPGADLVLCREREPHQLERTEHAGVLVPVCAVAQCRDALLQQVSRRLTAKRKNRRGSLGAGVAASARREQCRWHHQQQSESRRTGDEARARIARKREVLAPGQMP